MKWIDGPWSRVAMTVGLTGMAIYDAYVGDWLWFWVNIVVVAGLLAYDSWQFRKESKLPEEPTARVYPDDSEGYAVTFETKAEVITLIKDAPVLAPEDDA